MTRSFEVFSKFFLMAALAAITFFCSCGKSSQKIKLVDLPGNGSAGQDEIVTANEPSSTADDSLDKFDREVATARMFDTPIPLSYSFISKTSQEGLTSYVFQGALQANNVQKFYLEEMERLGWAITDFSSNDEVMIVCNKTSKSCVINSRHSNIVEPGKSFIKISVKNIDPKNKGQAV
jgi:hypothetical protein